MVEIVCIPWVCPPFSQVAGHHQDDMKHIPRILNYKLVGGVKYFLVSLLFGEDSQFDSYFSKGLKPPTSKPSFVIVTGKGKGQPNNVSMLNVRCRPLKNRGWFFLTTPPKFNSSPLKINRPNRKVVFQPPFSGANC